MKRTPALITCFLAAATPAFSMANTSPSTDISQMLVENLGLNTPSTLVVQPAGLMYGRNTVMGLSRYYQASSRHTSPGFSGIDLALAENAAPGVWMDVGRFGVDSLSFCDSLSRNCDGGVKSDYLLRDVGQGGRRFGLEASSDSSGAINAAYAASNEALDFDIRGSHLRKPGSSGVYDTEDTELMFSLGASSLPGAKMKQRTELSWLFQESSLPLEGDHQLVNRERQRIHLNHHSGQVGQSHSRTDLFWQESTIGFEIHGGAEPAETNLVEYFEAGGIPGMGAGASYGETRYQSYGLQSQNSAFYGKHLFSYLLGYQRDSADYTHAGRPALQGITDTASVLTVGLEARFNLSWMELVLDSGWQRADVERDSSEAGTDSLVNANVEGWRYGLGLLMLDRHFSIWGRHGFTPPAPSNDSASMELFDGFSIDGVWPAGSFTLKGQMWTRQYENMHLDCTELDYCNGLKGAQQFNLADVDAIGAGLSATWLGEFGSFSIPLSVGIEESRSEITTPQCLSVVSRCFRADDEIPWLPERQLSMALGIRTGEWSMTVSGRQTTYPEGDNTRVDAVFAWTHRQHSAYLRAENLTQEDAPFADSEFGLREGEVLFSLGYSWHG